MDLKYYFDVAGGLPPEIKDGLYRIRPVRILCQCHPFSYSPIVNAVVRGRARSCAVVCGRALSCAF